jgi:hypothetical protein
MAKKADATTVEMKLDRMVKQPCLLEDSRASTDVALL